MGEERTKIALRPAGNEETGFFSEHPGSKVFQPVHGGIVPENIVPHFGFRHHSPHLRSRPGHRVAPQVDQAHRKEP